QDLKSPLKEPTLDDADIDKNFTERQHRKKRCSERLKSSPAQLPVRENSPRPRGPDRLATLATRRCVRTRLEAVLRNFPPAPRPWDCMSSSLRIELAGRGPPGAMNVNARRRARLRNGIRRNHPHFAGDAGDLQIGLPPGIRAARRTCEFCFTV